MLPNDVMEVLQSRMQIGESYRMLHEDCSIGKDPCLNVTRTKDGFKFYCHRCGTGGFRSLRKLTPEETAAAYNRMCVAKEEQLIEYQEVEKLSLPADVIPLWKTQGNIVKWNSTEVPFHSIEWLMKFYVTEPSYVRELTLYWSNKLQRLIFPMWSTNGLIGYVARDTKKREENKHDNMYPKWLTRKSAEVEDRLFYIRHGYRYVTWVEDALSAVRIAKATGCTAIALLNTSLSFEYAKRYKAVPQFLWLDPDMHSKSIKKMAELRQKGIDIRSIRTDKDPKYYDDDEILKEVYPWTN